MIPHMPEERITLDEPSKVLRPLVLLRIISGFRIQNWESYDQVEGVFAAAEKYDMEMLFPLFVLR